MPRKLRIQYPKAMYDVMNRGDRRKNIFWNDEDPKGFLSTLGEACEKTEWQVHGYCLMRNHFHLVIETPQVNLVEGMKWLLGVIVFRPMRLSALGLGRLSRVGRVRSDGGNELVLTELSDSYFSRIKRFFSCPRVRKILKRCQ